MPATVERRARPLVVGHLVGRRRTLRRFDLVTVGRLGIVAGTSLAAVLAAAVYGRPYNFFDLRIYHGAVVWWTGGGELYSFIAPQTTLGFTYPPFAALAMLPMALVSPEAAGWLNVVATLVRGRARRAAGRGHRAAPRDARVRAGQPAARRAGHPRPRAAAAPRPGRRHLGRPGPRRWPGSGQRQRRPRSGGGQRGPSPGARARAAGVAEAGLGGRRVRRRGGRPRHGDQAHARAVHPDRKSTRLNSSHVKISYAVFCLKKKK